MANIYNRVKVRVSGTPGTGTITLGLPSSGFQTFEQAGAASGSVVEYLLEEGTNWELGVGTYTNVGGLATLTRDTVIDSSLNDGDKISISSSCLVISTPYTVAAGANSGFSVDLLNDQPASYYLERSNHTGVSPNTATTFASVTEAEDAVDLENVDDVYINGTRYTYTATPVSSGGFQNTDSSRWYKLTGDFIYSGNPIFADVDEAAQYAYEEDIPLWLSFDIAYVNLTPNASATDTPKARHRYLMEALRWRQRCIVSGSGQLWLRLNEEGLITVDAYQWDLSTNRLPVIYGGAHSTVYMCGAGYDTRTISTLRISARALEGDYPIVRGPNGYKVTVTTSTDLPSYLEVGMAVGIQNPAFDNDGQATAGAHIIESITLPRTFTFTTHSTRATDLVEPSASGTGLSGITSIIGVTANTVVIPKTTLAWDTDFTAGTPKTITGITQTSPAVVTSVAHGFSNQPSTSSSFVRLEGVVGMTELNGRDFMVRNVTTDTFELYTLDNVALDTTGYTAYSSGGTATTVIEAWTGADVEGYLNIERGGSLWIQELGVAYRGWLSGRTGSQKDQDAIAPSRDFSTLNISTAGVIAGAGDKVIRMSGSVTCFLNLGFVGGGGCQEALYSQVGGHVHAQRFFFGPAIQNTIGLALNSNFIFSRCQFTGGSRAIYSLSNSNVYLGTCIIFGSNIGIEAGASRLAFTTVQVTNNNVGTYFYGLSDAQGILTFSGNAVDSRTIENGEGTTNTNYGGARWNTSQTGTQSLPYIFDTVNFGAGGFINLDSAVETDAGAGVTIDKMAGSVTSQALTTAAGSKDTITVTNSLAASSSHILCSVVGGTYTTGIPYVTITNRTAGSFVININNTHPSAALNGTVIVQFQISSA